MHELAIAESIVNISLREFKRSNLTSVKSIGIRIGVLSGVDPSALEFGFETIIMNTPLSGAKLKIEMVPVSAVCRSCGTPFETSEFIFICPNCSSGDIEVKRGQELDIIYLEAD